MCGIVGYVGEKQAAPILLDGLSKLEYRGYDSAGIAVYDGQEIEMKKSKGRLKVLNELTHDGATLPGTVGIGHTRWATHGEPSDVNVWVRLQPPYGYGGDRPSAGLLLPGKSAADDHEDYAPHGGILCAGNYV